MKLFLKEIPLWVGSKDGTVCISLAIVGDCMLFFLLHGMYAINILQTLCSWVLDHSMQPAIMNMVYTVTAPSFSRSLNGLQIEIIFFSTCVPRGQFSGPYCTVQSPHLKFHFCH